MAEKLDINSVAMEVILNAGDGRQLIDEALDAATSMDFLKAKELLEAAEEKVLNAHRAQTKVIQEQVSGEDVEYSLLFVHAQDTIMTVNSELRMAKKMMQMCKMIEENGGKQ